MSAGADATAVGADGAAVPEPEFEVLGARPLRHAAAPTLLIDVQLTERSGRQVYMAALTVQLMIEPARRAYDRAARERLEGLFGPPERWAMTTRSVVWAQLDVLVPPFIDSTVVAVPVSCNYDMEIAAARYMSALEDGVAPLALHFNGTVYYRDERGGLQMALVPWSRSIDFRMPVSVWRETIDHYYPGSGWIGLGTDTIRALERERVRRGLPTYDACLARLLEEGRNG